MLLALATVLTFALSPAAAQAQTQTPPTRTLSITGSAELHVAPDTALVSLGVVTEAASAASALKDNSAAVAKVLDAVRAGGVDAKDMQTRSLSLEPRYERIDKPGPSDRPRIIGYSAENLVTLRVRDLGKIGDLLDKLTGAGVNRIDSISFVVSNEDKLLDETRQRAVADAREKADLYARAAGFSLGKIMSLNEESGSTPPPRPMMMARNAAAPAPVPVEGGEMTLTVRVHIIWSLAD
ncbi:MAG TPA: SIMPL domain-containing protein [Xanthobacteraceae bacterium]|nr:SIMPL domain-containing protein [Xanthobacteraceae bacterium]